MSEPKRTTISRRPPTKEPNLRLRDEPLYSKIFTALQSKILNGEFRDGGYLPSENDLARTFKVSRITATRALNELAAVGLAVREKGRGTRIRIASAGRIVRGPSASGLGQAAKSRKPRSDTNDRRIRLIELKTIKAPSDAAHALGIRAGCRIVYLSRVLNFGGHPFGYVMTYFSPGLGTAWRKEQFDTQLLARLLETESIVIRRSEENIHATHAAADVANHLGTKPDEPLLRITRISYDDYDRPVMYRVAYHPSERYSYTVSSYTPGGPFQNEFIGIYSRHPDIH